MSNTPLANHERSRGEKGFGRKKADVIVLWCDSVIRHGFERVAAVSSKKGQKAEISVISEKVYWQGGQIRGEKHSFCTTVTVLSLHCVWKAHFSPFFSIQDYNSENREGWVLKKDLIILVTQMIVGKLNSKQIFEKNIVLSFFRAYHCCWVMVHKPTYVSWVKSPDGLFGWKNVTSIYKHTWVRII